MDLKPCNEVVPTAAVATVVMGVTEPSVPGIDVQNVENFTLTIPSCKAILDSSLMSKQSAGLVLLGVLVAAKQGGSTSALQVKDAAPVMD